MACSTSSTKTKTINVTVLSVNDFDLEAVSIYPNPTSGKLYLKQENGFEKIEVILSDLTGKSILTSSANNLEELSVDLSNLSKGVYILNITTDNHSYIDKVIKK